MSNPRFSIVIPTRNRHNTLKFALLTCLNQNFDDYEIIVCDNCSSPETRETVMSFESEKIKYIRSDRPLAMSHNWELAVSQAKGEFVTLIGDDDGLLLNALSKIDQLIKILGVKALHWEWVNYHWPDIPTGNWLNIPLVRKNRILKSSTVIPNVANCRMSVFDSLPMIYNSAIHRDLINQLKERTGRVFSALAPDVYSGFAFAYLAQSYACIGLPLGVAGKSSDSAGQATLWSKNNSNALEFSKLNAEANLGYCHHIPDIPVLPVFVADSFQRAKDNLFPYDKEININRKRFILNCITQLRERVFAGVESEEDLRMHLSTINALSLIHI